MPTTSLAAVPVSEKLTFVKSATDSSKFAIDVDVIFLKTVSVEVAPVYAELEGRNSALPFKD